MASSISLILKNFQRNNPPRSRSRERRVLPKHIPSATTYSRAWRQPTWKHLHLRRKFERKNQNLPSFVDRQSVNLTSPNVDLTVLTPAVSATTTKANDTVTVSWSVKNPGTETVTGQWLDGVFLSTDDKLDLRQYGQVRRDLGA